MQSASPEFRATRAHIESLEAHLGNLPLTASGDVALGGSEPSFDLKLATHNAPVQEILQLQIQLSCLLMLTIPLV